MTERLPKNLRRRAARRCYCGRPVPASSGCGCCCSEHDVDVDSVARALMSIGTPQPPPPRTDAPSLREFLASKGEL